MRSRIASKRSSGIASKAATTPGSNCVPAERADLLARLRPGRRGAVRAVGGERVERVGDREHARGERDLLAAQPVGIAGAVPALVVVADDELARRRGSRCRAGSPSRSRGGCAISAYSSSVSGSGLKRIASGTATLPTSCSRKPNSISGESAMSRPARARDLEPVGGDALGVPARVGVARLDRVGERAHGRQVGALELLGARALLLEGLAQVGGVALELALARGGLALGRPRRAAEAGRRCPVRSVGSRRSLRVPAGCGQTVLTREELVPLAVLLAPTAFAGAGRPPGHAVGGLSRNRTAARCPPEDQLVPGLFRARTPSSAS